MDLRVGDLDRDGIPDIAVSLDLDAIAVIHNNGNRTMTAPVQFGAGFSVGIADFDEDGRPDLVSGYGDESDIGGCVLYNRFDALAAPEPRPAGADLAIVAVSPNPLSGSARVALRLASGAPATLRMFDVQGRKLLSRRVEGSREIELRPPASLRAGVYLLRLSQGSSEATTRICLVR